MRIITIEDWLKIGSKAKELRDNCNELSLLTSTITPKRKFNRLFFRLGSTEGQIRSDLEDLMFQQHPSLSDEGLKIFYGTENPNPHILFVRHSNVQRMGTEQNQGTSAEDPKGSTSSVGSETRTE